MKLTKVRTILFTEACPLACRYCYLKDDDAFGEFPALTHEQFIDTVALYDKIDNPDEERQDYYSLVASLFYTGSGLKRLYLNMIIDFNTLLIPAGICLQKKY